MLYELYKNFYFNFYDNLIIWLLHFSLIIIFKFIKFFKKNVHFTSIRRPLALRALCLGPKRFLCLSVPLAFTNGLLRVMYSLVFWILQYARLHPPSLIGFFWQILKASQTLKHSLHFENVWVVFGYKSPLKVWQWEREGEETTMISY